MQERDSLCKLDIAVNLHRLGLKPAVKGTGSHRAPKCRLASRHKQPERSIGNRVSSVCYRRDSLAGWMRVVMAKNAGSPRPRRLVSGNEHCWIQFEMAERVVSNIGSKAHIINMLFPQ